MNTTQPHPAIEQMELTLHTATRPRGRRPTVSRWWFARMREAVRTAREWPSRLDDGNWGGAAPAEPGEDCPLPVGGIVP